MGNEKATRDSFGEALLAAGEANPKLVVVSCDLSDATKTKEFGKKFPARFFEVGIAEQNGISIAAGLALEGFRPFISSFGAFITGRYDQLRISCAYNRAGVVIVGTHSGLAIGKDGATQMGTEDLNVISALPGLQIFQPCDDAEAKAIVGYLSREKCLAYLRLSRRPQEQIHTEGYSFRFNKAEILREGNGISIFATGDSVLHSLKAADKLNDEGIEADVVNFSTLKPIDRGAIIEFAGKRKAIVTVEDHSIIGGLGGRVCEVVAEAGLPCKVKRVGIRDCFGESGKPEDLYRKYGLDVEGIAKAVSGVAASLK